MVALWPYLRFVKFASLAVLIVGVVGSTISTDRQRRVRFTYGYAVPGLVVAYAAGWLLMKGTGLRLSTPWVLGGALAGGAALHLTFTLSHRVQYRDITPRLCWGSGVAALAVMTMRTATWGSTAVALLAGAILGALAVGPWAKIRATPGEADGAQIRRRLRALTWLEGTSLLVMVGLAMPLRVATGFSLDASTGTLGWVHGVLVLVFVQALWSARRACDWPRSVGVWGTVSAMIPVASFVFDRWLPPAPSPSTETVDT